MKPLRALSNGIEKIESILVALALLFMIGLAFLQVLLRNLWDTGISWGDPIIRALVLWVGFLGASIATHQEGHIRLDVVSKFLPPKTKRVTECLVHLASAVVCVLLAKAAWDFVQMEREFETMLVDKIPNWIALIIIPVSFLVIAFRMVLSGLGDFFGLLKHEEGVKD